MERDFSQTCTIISELKNLAATVFKTINQEYLEIKQKLEEQVAASQSKIASLEAEVAEGFSEFKKHFKNEVVECKARQKSTIDDFKSITLNLSEQIKFVIEDVRKSKNITKAKLAQVHSEIRDEYRAVREELKHHINEQLRFAQNPDSRVEETSASPKEQSVSTESAQIRRLNETLSGHARLTLMKFSEVEDHVNELTLNVSKFEDQIRSHFELSHDESQHLLVHFNKFANSILKLVNSQNDQNIEKMNDLKNSVGQLELKLQGLVEKKNSGGTFTDTQIKTLPETSRKGSSAKKDRFEEPVPENGDNNYLQENGQIAQTLIKQQNKGFEQKMNIIVFKMIPGLISVFRTLVSQNQTFQAKINELDSKISENPVNNENSKETQFLTKTDFYKFEAKFTEFSKAVETQMESRNVEFELIALNSKFERKLADMEGYLASEIGEHTPGNLRQRIVALEQLVEQEESQMFGSANNNVSIDPENTKTTNEIKAVEMIQQLKEDVERQLMSQNHRISSLLREKHAER